METLISPQEVIDLAFSADPRNRPSSISRSKIIVAQERFIRPALGKIYPTLSQSSLAAFVNEYIKPPLAFFVKFSMIDEMAIVLSDDGVHLNMYEEKGYETQQNLNKNEESKSTKNNSGSQTKSSTATGKNANVETTVADLEKNTDRSKTEQSEITKDEVYISTGKNEKKISDTIELKGNTQTLTDRETESVGTNPEKQVLASTVTKNDSSTKTESGTDTTNITKNENNTIATAQKTTGSDNSRETSGSTVSKEHDGQTQKTETQDNTSSSSGTDVTASSNEETRNDQYTGTAKKRNPASDHQRNLLKKQAYIDAKILLGVAIRHINEHKEAFGLSSYKHLKNYQPIY